MAPKHLYIYSFLVGESHKATGHGIVWARDVANATDIVKNMDHYWTNGKKIVFEEFRIKDVIKRFSWVEA